MKYEFKNVKKYTPLIVFGVFMLLIGGSFAAYMLRSMSTTGATINVIANSFSVEIYDDIDLLVESGSIWFPAIYIDDLSGQDCVSNVYYLSGIDVDEDIWCQWNSTIGDLYPDDLTLIAEWYNVDTWESWDYESEAIPLTITQPTLKIRFVASAVSAYVNGYSFDITVLATSSE